MILLSPKLIVSTLLSPCALPHLDEERLSALARRDSILLAFLFKEQEDISHRRYWFWLRALFGMCLNSFTTGSIHSGSLVFWAFLEGCACSRGIV